MNYKFFHSILLGLLIGLLCGACTISNSGGSNVNTKETPEKLKLGEGTPINIKAVADANNKSGFNLFQKMRSSHKNLFISPYSISSAMAMTYAGATADSEQEIAAFFQWPENTKGLHSGVHNLIKTLDAEKNKLFKINVANRIYLNQGLRLFDEFAKVNQELHGAGVETLSFEDHTVAANKINQWVSNKTEHMIPKLLDDMTLKGAKMVLVNAIFFYGGWANAFEKEQTQPDEFFVSKEDTRTVQMMNNYWGHHDEKEEVFQYYEDEVFQVLALPYHKNKGEMIIFLPKQTASSDLSYGQLMDNMTYDDVVARINALSPWAGNLKLKIPKWEQRTKTSLKRDFMAMGMVHPFSNSAGFERITDEVQLKISDVIHEAVVEVSEKGTKAAAATAVITKETTAIGEPAKTVKFIANHPFFYIIKDNTTNTFLFMGQLIAPEE